jgi:hypothetical protein
MGILGRFSRKGSQLVMIKIQWCKTKVKVETCKEGRKEREKKERKRGSKNPILFILKCKLRRPMRIDDRQCEVDSS